MDSRLGQKINNRKGENNDKVHDSRRQNGEGH